MSGALPTLPSLLYCFVLFANNALPECMVLRWLDYSKGVDKLHSQALEIGEEAKQHVRIINDLDKQVDKTADSLQQG
jgi:hypothetical protein